MDEVISQRDVLAPGRLRALSTRRDGPGIVRAAVHGGLLVAGILLASNEALPVVLRALALVGAGLLWGLLFGPFHETMHRTAFRSAALNEVVYVLTAVPQLFTPTGYRAFHFAHHRATHDPARDPEIAPAPWFLGAWPRSAWVHLLLLTGLHLLVLKIAMLLGMAFGPRPLFEAQMAWLPVSARRRTVWEARGVLLVWGMVGWAAWSGATWAIVLWLLQVLGHTVFAPLQMAEHHGLPPDGDVTGRTRSIRTIAPLRWFFWNMPYHAEHHGWPSVPFHALPALHAEVAPHLPHREAGYLAIHLGARRG